MAKKVYQKKSKEEIQAQNKELKEKIEQEQDSIWYEEGNLLEYLKFAAVFHNYSVCNQLLIHAQYPNATMVASYRNWNKRKRNVRKGENGIAIFAPTPRKKTVVRDMKDENGNDVLDDSGEVKKESAEVTFMNYRHEYVFDVTQTEGEPVPELEAMSEDPLFETAGDLNHALGDVCDGDLNAVSTKDMLTKAVRNCFLEEFRSYTDAEVEACSYILSSYMQLGTDGYSVGKILRWANGKEKKEVRAFMNRVQKVSKKIIGQLPQTVLESA